MATIRDSLQDELLQRLATLGDYVVGRRQPGVGDADVPKLALLLETSESVLDSDTMTTTKELTLEVFVQVRAEDAPPELADNAERYLLDEIGRVEAALFTPPWLTNNEELKPRGSKPVPEEQSNLVRGILTLAVTYRHNVGDPSTFNPYVVT